MKIDQGIVSLVNDPSQIKRAVVAPFQDIARSHGSDKVEKIFALGAEVEFTGATFAVGGEFAAPGRIAGVAERVALRAGGPGLDSDALLLSHGVTDAGLRQSILNTASILQSWPTLHQLP